jgi:hypothetical protein
MANREIIFRPVQLVEDQDVEWFNATAREIGAVIRVVDFAKPELELVLNGNDLKCESHSDEHGLVWTNKKTGVYICVDWGDPAHGIDYGAYVVHLK